MRIRSLFFQGQHPEPIRRPSLTVPFFPMAARAPAQWLMTSAIVYLTVPYYMDNRSVLELMHAFSTHLTPVLLRRSPLRTAARRFARCHLFLLNCVPRPVLASTRDRAVFLPPALLAPPTLDPTPPLSRGDTGEGEAAAESAGALASATTEEDDWRLVRHALEVVESSLCATCAAPLPKSVGANAQAWQGGTKEAERSGESVAYAMAQQIGGEGVFVVEDDGSSDGKAVIGSNTECAVGDNAAVQRPSCSEGGDSAADKEEADEGVENEDDGEVMIVVRRLCLSAVCGSAWRTTCDCVLRALLSDANHLKGLPERRQLSESRMYSVRGGEFAEEKEVIGTQHQDSGPYSGVTRAVRVECGRLFVMQSAAVWAWRAQSSGLAAAAAVRLVVSASTEATAPTNLFDASDSRGCTSLPLLRRAEHGLCARTHHIKPSARTDKSNGKLRRGYANFVSLYYTSHSIFGADV